MQTEALDLRPMSVEVEPEELEPLTRVERTGDRMRIDETREVDGA